MDEPRSSGGQAGFLIATIRGGDVRVGSSCTWPRPALALCNSSPRRVFPRNRPPRRAAVISAVGHKLPPALFREHRTSVRPASISGIKPE
jgi:hypothetical protein